MTADRRNTEASAGKSMTVTAAISMGVGAMVGAGIFALLGEAGSKAGNAVYLSFAIAGFISLLSGYSYAKLGTRYPSSGGIVEFLVQAYGGGYFTGIISMLLYLSVVVVMALVAEALGSYAKALFVPDGPELWVNCFASAAVVGLTFVNAIGSKLVGGVEKLIVFLKVLILLVFVGAGVLLIKLELLFATSGARSTLDVVGTVAICLLAYHGFGVITNTVEDMPTPSVTLPRAVYGAIGIVMVLYVGVAVSVFGNLPLSDIVRAKDYAMAEAAKPIFGQVGFTVIAIAAVLSAASSINANLYSTAKMTYLLARDGELPKFEAQKIWHGGTGGLFTTAALVLLIANVLDLTRIAALGSIVYLTVYSAVHFGHWKRLVGQTGANTLVVLAALAANAGILLVFGVQTAITHPFVLYSLAFLVIASTLIEIHMQKNRGRTIKSATN